MTADIIFSEQAHLGVITLNRMSAFNALNFNMIDTLKDQLQKWAIMPHIHAVVVQSVPGKAFCAGGDVRWLYEMGLQRQSQQMQFFWREYNLNYLIHSYPKPYIALMDGLTMGGGVGISLHGSHSVASEHFVFAMPETTIGFFPDIGSSYLLTRCPGNWGKYLGLTGHRLNAGEAKALNLVKYTIPSHAFSDTLSSLSMLDLSSDADKKIERCLQQFEVSDPAENITKFHHFVNDCFSSDDMILTMEQLQLGKDSWHQETYDTLLQKAPLSLHVTLKQLATVKKQNMETCLKLDYCLTGHFTQDHDLYEGIRALLIDKDKNPQWQPSDLFKVDAAQVDAYFVAENNVCEFRVDKA